MSHQFDIILRPVPEPWTNISHYLVYGPLGGLVVCPIHKSINGIAISIWADERAKGKTNQVQAIRIQYLLNLIVDKGHIT